VGFSAQTGVSSLLFPLFSGFLYIKFPMIRLKYIGVSSVFHIRRESRLIYRYPAHLIACEARFGRNDISWETAHSQRETGVEFFINCIVDNFTRFIYYETYEPNNFLNRYFSRQPKNSASRDSNRKFIFFRKLVRYIEHYCHWFADVRE